jgi:hypothetical protein
MTPSLRQVVVMSELRRLPCQVSPTRSTVANVTILDPGPLPHFMLPAYAFPGDIAIGFGTMFDTLEFCFHTLNAWSSALTSRKFASLCPPATVCSSPFRVCNSFKASSWPLKHPLLSFRNLLYFSVDRVLTTAKIVNRVAPQPSTLTKHNDWPRCSSNDSAFVPY